MLVTFEGIDGSGKSTQINLLNEIYKDIVVTKEPGGTKFGQILREILLNGKEISFKTEILLFLADRAEHYDKIILPNKERLVLSDRGFISGIAYAMANDTTLDIEKLLDLNNFALNGDFGDKFIFFEIDEKTIVSRFKERNLDKIESRGIEYLLRVQDYMKMIFKNSKFNVLKVDAGAQILEIHEQIKEFIK
ncbi:MAG: dTMP kinase [Campylobacter sp.]|nr:dTMP kinase [Campylobacter sp.]